MENEEKLAEQGGWVGGNFQPMHVLPTYKLRGIPSSPPDHMQINEAADKIADVLSYLFGGTVGELGIVIYSKFCYVSPHM